MRVRSRRRARKVLLASTLCLGRKEQERALRGPASFSRSCPKTLNRSNGSFSMLPSDANSPIVAGPPQSLVPRGTRGFAVGAVSALIVVKLARGGKAAWKNCQNRVERNSSVGSRESEKAQVELRGAFVGGEVSGAGDNANGRCEDRWGASALRTSGWDGDSAGEGWSCLVKRSRGYQGRRSWSESGS